MNNDTQKQQFLNEGVVRLGEILGVDELFFYATQLKDIMSSNDYTKHNIFNLAALKHEKTHLQTLQLINVYKKLPDFINLIKHPKIISFVKSILGDNIKVLRDQAFYKPPKIGGEVYMHQDNRYWHLSEPQAVIVWIAFDDATLENGCLKYILSSHNEGKIEHTQANLGQSVQLEANAMKAKSVAYEVKQGDALAHHCQIVHWSSENTSQYSRLAYTIVYIAERIFSKKYEGPYLDI
jgi:2-oxoglutarate-dependent dioxygenase